MSEKIKKKYKPVDIVLIVIAAVLAFLFVYPVLFAFMSAFKSNGDILRAPAAFPTSIYTQNFVDLFQMSDFGHAIINTVFLTVASELLIICIVPMAAYGIERRKCRFSTFLYTFFIAGMMIPFHLYMFPLFKETLEVEEAAVIDGCGPFRTFWRITFPLLGPCNASMVILNGLGIWNDYLMPYLVLPSGKAKTITVEIAGFVGQFTARWDIVFAGTIISIIPALAIFCAFQKYFVKGIMAGAAKG